MNHRTTVFLSDSSQEDLAWLKAKHRELAGCEVSSSSLIRQGIKVLCHLAGSDEWQRVAQEIKARESQEGQHG